MSILVAIDGTGENLTERATWEPRDIRASFVRRFYAACPFQNKKYFTGPDVAGGLCGDIFRDAVAFLDGVLKGNPNRGHAISLIGYSRGAYLCTCLARYLGEQRGLPVNFLGLFDAVGRTDFGMGFSSDLIPATVRVCCHAHRDIRAGSRVFFGNSGIWAEKGVQFYKQKFVATHSAMGGMPWRGDHPPRMTEQQDRDGAADVCQWMSGHAHRRGIIGVSSP